MQRGHQPPPRVVLARRRRGRPLHVTDGRRGVRRNAAARGTRFGASARRRDVRWPRRRAGVGRPHAPARDRRRWFGVHGASASRFVVAPAGGGAQARDPAWRRRRPRLAQRRSRLRAAVGLAGRRLSERCPLDAVRVRSCARRPERERPRVPPFTCPMPGLRMWRTRKTTALAGWHRSIPTATTRSPACASRWRGARWLSSGCPAR